MIEGRQSLQHARVEQRVGRPQLPEHECHDGRGAHRGELALDLGDVLADEETLSSAEKRRLTLRRVKEQKIERLFQDWTEWFERTRRMVADPNPHVDVKAVLVG